MEAAYWIAIIGLGTASGVAILAQRQHDFLAPLINLIASMSGIADIALAVAAFIKFPIRQALALVLTAFFITGIVSAKLPPKLRGGQVLLFAIVGAAAACISFLLPASLPSV